MSKKIELYVFPKTGCVAKRVTIHPFEVNNYTPKDDEEYLLTLEQIISQDQKPVQIDVCLNENLDFKKCNGHVTVLPGYREKCCGNVCQKQYQLTDSMRNVWSNSEEDGWISQEELLKKTKAFKNSKQRSLTWLSSQSKNGNLNFTYSIPQSKGDAATIPGIKEDSPEFKARLRNGMNYGTHQFDSKTKEMTVLIKNEDGSYKEFKYQN
ncbi:MAG: hypothetical protein AB7I27_00070 [Bacteriovoracaceae bacterium]